ncbi:hypothetical protein [Amycolatopsis sp. PS_44_ISF1]|uniref:hypothetical protein n=1 Tax=Amycolatopsis sp. PS_44_ISF1 TaxID=2974917 RepID=UPI0028DDD01D|nr:hypothetical protein [Amycolatopsis sp. PS_44_ISF1]MDT8910162.1 hypothetical protein [Amycolatopsis sp. PS_44_ISF1]
MLQAKRSSLLGHDYEISRDDQPFTRLELKRHSARFSVDRAEYQVKGHRFRRTYELLAADGSVVASTGRVSRTWTLEAAGRAVRFERPSPLSRETSMLGEDGQPAGSIRRQGAADSGATADLPGLEPRLELFALAVVLMRQRSKRTAAGARGAALSGG